MEEQTCNPDTSGSWPLMNDLTMASPTRPCANCWLMESPTNNMFRSVHAVVVKFCIRSSEMEGGNGGNNSTWHMYPGTERNLRGYVTSSGSWRRNDIRTSRLLIGGAVQCVGRTVCRRRCFRSASPLAVRPPDDPPSRFPSPMSTSSRRVERRRRNERKDRRRREDSSQRAHCHRRDRGRSGDGTALP